MTTQALQLPLGRRIDATHLLKAGVTVVLGWYETARQRRRLTALDDRMLLDIGVTREQVLAEAGKAFYK